MMLCECIMFRLMFLCLMFLCQLTEPGADWLAVSRTPFMYKSQDACVYLGNTYNPNFGSRSQYIHTLYSGSTRPGSGTSQPGQERETPIFPSGTSVVCCGTRLRRSRYKRLGCSVGPRTAAQPFNAAPPLRQPESFLPPPLPVCQLTTNTNLAARFPPSRPTT